MFIIRPDGNNTDFCNCFRKQLSVAGITIVEEKEIVFTPDDVAKYFYYQFPDYIKYMTTGASRCVFVESMREDLDAKILEIKETLRSEYGVSNRCLKSLIHSSQSGTELFLQKQIFGDKYYHPEYRVCGRKRL